MKIFCSDEIILRIDDFINLMKTGLCNKNFSLQSLLMGCKFISEMKIYQIINICNGIKFNTVIKFITGLKIYQCDDNLSL